MTALQQDISALRRKDQETAARLTEGDQTFARISNDTAQIMDVLDALLLHFISDNDVGKLKEVKKSMDHYKSVR